MRMSKGRVVGGKVVIEGEPLEEGAVVTVLAPDPDERFELNPDDEAELLRRMADIRKGNFVDGDDVLRTLAIPE